MRIYLDVCCIQRPFDAKVQPRVVAEAEAVLKILAACDGRRAELVTSTALGYEAGRDRNRERLLATTAILARATTVGRVSPAVIERARILQVGGVKTLDSYHLAFAAELGADFFCTCDDRLLRRARVAHQPPPAIVTPLQLLQELSQ